MSWQFAFTGAYDKALVDYFSQFISPGTVVLDIGASLGLWTIPLAKVAWARGARVWAFEPSPANVAVIRRNVSLNELDSSVTVCNVGLGDRKESVTLVSTDYGVGNAVIALGNEPATEKFPRLTVPIDRLDDIALPARVSVVKVDIEGYEAAFLRGAAETIRRDRPIIFGEFSEYWLTRRGEDLRATIASLSLSDYRIDIIRATRRRPWSKPAVQLADVAPDGALPTNLLFRPAANEG